MQLSTILKKGREKIGLSLREVESKLNEKGINYAHTNIKRIEDDDTVKVSVKVLGGLCEIYRLNKVEVFNAAGANMDEEVEVNNLLKQNGLLFENEFISKEDKKKYLEAVMEMYYQMKFEK